jgi:hypothetical protein
MYTFFSCPRVFFSDTPTQSTKPHVRETLPLLLVCALTSVQHSFPAGSARKPCPWYCFVRYLRTAFFFACAPPTVLRSPINIRIILMCKNSAKYLRKEKKQGTVAAKHNRVRACCALLFGTTMTTISASLGMHHGNYHPSSVMCRMGAKWGVGDRSNAAR